LAGAGPQPSGPAAEDDPADVLEAGDLTLDGERFRAAWKGKAVTLTVTEFRILRSLARRPGVVKDRDALLSEAFPQDAYMGDRSVDCHIKRIRRKLCESDPGFDGIETVYGLGYRWRDGGRGEG
jgi:two-component system, OmpR family, response regulator ChvI